MLATPDTNTTERADEELMASLQNGDDSALAPLLDRWELGVKAFLLRLGVPSADVEDVAQEAFVRLYEKRQLYRAGSPFKPWLLTIAGNLGRNRRRWRFRRREDSIEALDTERPGGIHLSDTSSLSAAALAEKSSLARSVRAAVQALPDSLRDSVVCVDLEELSYAEAAAVMGCTPKAVETRLYRARQILRVSCRALRPDA